MIFASAQSLVEYIYILQTLWQPLKKVKKTYIETEQRMEKKCILVRVTWSPCCTVEKKN